jgi:RsiW-degrading membrane proteinase PrsW (M82 family)
MALDWWHPLLVGLPVMPGLAWLYLVYRTDREHPEPKRFVLLTFALGALAVLPAAWCEERLIDLVGKAAFAAPGSRAGIALTCFLIVGPLEEIAKFMAVRGFMYRHREFDEPIDAIVYAGAASLGFASVENLLYVLDLHGGISVRWDVLGIRALLSLPGHVAFAATWGYALARVRFGRWRRAWPALIAASLLHGLYDFVVLDEQLRPLVGLFLALMIPIVIRQIALLRDDPA